MIGGVFDNLKATKTESKRVLDKVDTVSLSEFISKVFA